MNTKKINSKSNTGLWLRFETINPIHLYKKGEYHIEISTSNDTDFKNKEVFIKEYFKNMFTISRFNSAIKDEEIETPDGEFINEKNKYIEFYISLKNESFFDKEVYSYLSDLVDYEIPFSELKQTEIIKNLIKNKYQESENKKICLTINDLDWNKFIHVKFFNILRKLKKEGFIEKIDVQSFFAENLPTIIEFRRPKLCEYKYEINEVRRNFFFEMEVILSNKFIKELTLDVKNKKKPKIQADYKDGVIYFSNKKIDFNKKDNQKELLDVLFTEPLKYWFYDEIQTDWDGFWNEIKTNNPKSKKYWQKFYTAGDGINRAIAIETGVKDFIVKNTGTKGKIKINEKYI
ncbi:MAG: hypothetical protein A2312_02905 [Candidatus Staskawiczbacteria bacterium RIFOXYB2_FULL_32_9]|nr:MAG: hypothetical protein UR22_C0011G0030 [Parcubacteria group bacterium GW2011_GWC2_32_10]OGZ77929.1 MAG: hypothetical protein A2360_00165 [Candidatus Staskawiczbacteria bacterium RIFOXYB1_FULL_32_11]OGZ78354.1 MAG: hypothetical protein A2256_04170 [Candidatus Staskawiczbacteria bacterium RIFOXYA2_FULL_32_7]OGZ83511.1 MAG: hypothetical protein A2312_02905 [Candidatus Staskawiczbacteria bacterium RIFOXYB2_FULL_32_9]